MKRVLIGLISLTMVLVSCNKRWQEEGLYYRAPNWTSDGKIVFMRDHYIQKFEQDPFWGGTRQIGGHQEIFVCEIDVDGSNFREVCKVIDEEFDRGPNYEPASTSSWGDWIVVTIEDTFPQIGPHDGRMFVLKRDGSNLKEVGRGLYADISPDQKKFVYQKFNQGLWIKNIDGSGDRQIVIDTNATMPSWGTDNRRIAYGRYYLTVIDTSGNFLIYNYKPEKAWYGVPDCGPVDSNAVVVYQDGSRNGGTIVYFEGDTLVSHVRELMSGYGWKWSPDGSKLLAITTDGILVVDIDGTNKIYIKP